MKIVRWKYLLPRLAVALVVVAGFRWGLDPLLKWALVAGGESAVGAKVELAALESSLADGTLVVRGLAVANPSELSSNLLEAERAELHIDTTALWHRRYVVRSGRLSGIEFNTPRTRSGLLEEATPEEAHGPSLLDPWVEAANQFVTTWFGQIEDRLRADFAAELKTPQVAAELEQRWPQQYADLNAQAKSLRTRGKEMEQAFNELRKNPLRNLTSLQELQTQLLTAQHELKSLHQQIEQLPRQAEADRQAVLAARQLDEQFIRDSLRFASFDEDGISQTLLGQPTALGVASALDWLSWARKKIPSREGKHDAQRRRGTAVLFSPAQPRFLVEELQLEGMGRWGGASLALTGSLRNISSAPQLVGQPATLELRGTGAAEVDIRLTVDRRTPTPRDHLRIACPHFALPGQTLGHAEKLALRIAPTTAHFQIDLVLQDDQLQGQIALGQGSLNLKAQHASAANPQIAAAVNQALGSIQEWNANVQIAGTLQQPQIQLQSDLGAHLAHGLRTACKQVLDERAGALVAQSQQQIDTRLQQLQELRAKAERDLTARLGEGEQLFGQLAALSGSAQSSLPIPQLSKSLRLPTLRK